MAKKPLPFGFSNAKPDRPATFNYWVGQPPELTEIPIGAPAWFEWLARGQSFRLTYWSKAGSVAFVVRAETRKNSRNLYWQAWKTIGGQTRKKYLGPTARITKARLDAAGDFFLEQLRLAREEAEETPAGWEELNAAGKHKVERYIQTLLARQLAFDEDLLPPSRSGL